MKHKAKTWNYCWPDDPQPGLLHLEPPALSGEVTFWIQCGGGTSEEQDKIADRIAALWNMAERLGLSTEEIESGNVETKLKSAPDMLEALVDALVEVKMRIEEYITTCPLCGESAERGHKYYCLWHVANAAIKKARGE